MATVAAMSTQNNITQNDDVVCTPDFPIEPLCEVLFMILIYFKYNIHFIDFLLLVTDLPE